METNRPLHGFAHLIARCLVENMNQLEEPKTSMEYWQGVTDGIVVSLNIYTEILRMTEEEIKGEAPF